MKTLKLDLNENRQESLTIAARILISGGIVAMPTETVYGLAASALSDTAIKKVFAAKGRPQDNPLIVHICNIEMLNKVAVDIPEIAYKCAEAFWPGPFTMILKKADSICESVSAGLDTVAVRMPSSRDALDLIMECKIPLAAPSANTSGYPSPTSANHVISDLSGKINAVLIGEDCSVGVESTVITLIGEKPKLLRPGYITLEQLKEVIPDIIVDKAVFAEPEKGLPVASPGMKYKHYSPECEIVLVTAAKDLYAEFVNTHKDGLPVCFQEDADLIEGKYLVYGSYMKPENSAHNLFNVLRQLDREKIKKAYVHSPDTSGVGLAVYNRLLRAAAFKVLKL